MAAEQGSRDESLTSHSFGEGLKRMEEVRRSRKGRNAFIKRVTEDVEMLAWVQTNQLPLEDRPEFRIDPEDSHREITLGEIPARQPDPEKLREGFETLARITRNELPVQQRPQFQINPRDRRRRIT